MKIAIGADHRGLRLKEYLCSLHSIGSMPIEWLNMGTDDLVRTDYPIYAKRVARAVQEGQADRGILVCGTGIGMAVAANRFTSIYAAVLWSPHIACVSREDDGVNIAALPADYLAEEEARIIINAWLSCTFKQDRYEKRLTMIDAETE